MPRARLNKTDNERTNERANASNTLRMTCDLRVHGVRKGNGTENGIQCLSDNMILIGIDEGTALTDHHAIMLTDGFQFIRKCPQGNSKNCHIGQMSNYLAWCHII